MVVLLCCAFENDPRLTGRYRLVQSVDVVEVG